MQPGFEVIENGFGVFLSEADPFFRRLSLRDFLNSIKPGDTLNRFFRRRRTCAVKDIDELPANMRHARHLACLASAEDIVVPGIIVRMHPAEVAIKVAHGMLLLSVDGKLIPGCGWIAAGPGPLIANIGPDPGGLGLLVPRTEHFDWGIVRVNGDATFYISGDGLSQRRQKRRGFANPLRHR